MFPFHNYLSFFTFHTKHLYLMENVMEHEKRKEKKKTK